MTDQTAITKTSYAGNYIYEKIGVATEELKFFNQPEGYVEPDGSNGYNYIYQYKDHLGNIRLSYSDADGNGSINASTEIVEENNYYPFGLEHKGYNGNQGAFRDHKFEYANKETEEELGKNTIAFGWRDYDPTLGRFNKIDRFAEKYQNLSPYSYAANNPLRLIDVQGDSLAGVSKKSARRAKKIIRKGFRKNRKIARLFKTKGKGFKKISENKFNRATNGATREEKTLAGAYMKTINSKSTHHVEIVKKGERMSEFSQKNTTLLFAKNKMGSVLDMFGGGLNTGLRSKIGVSYSAILLNSDVPQPHIDPITGETSLHMENPSASLAHELLGHGYGRSINSSGYMEMDAMQMGNLQSRVMGSNLQRNQHEAESSILTKLQYSGIPTHFKF